MREYLICPDGLAAIAQAVRCGACGAHTTRPRDFHSVAPARRTSPWR